MYEWMNATLWVPVARAARYMDFPSLFLHLAGPGWLIRQRINDVASRKPEPDSDGPVRMRETVSRQDRHSDAGRGRDFSRGKL